MLSLKKLPALAALLALGSVLSCGDRVTGPNRHSALINVVPVFAGSVGAVGPTASASTFGAAIDNVRIRLLRIQAELPALDTTIAFPAAQDSLAITLRVPMDSEQEEFLAFIELRDGTTVLYSGTQSVVARRGGSPATASIPINYVGPGASATKVVIAPDSIVRTFGQTFVPSIVAYDADNAIVEDVPIQIVLDTGSVGTWDVVNKVYTAGVVPGAARLVASIPSGAADTTFITVIAQAPPSNYYIWSGDSGSFHDPSQWSKNAVPGAGDTAFVAGGTVTVNAPAALSVLLMSAGKLNGTDTLTIHGVFEWLGGALSGTGATVVAPTASAIISGPTEGPEGRTLDRNLLLRGQAVLTDGLDFVTPAGCVTCPAFTIAQTGTLYVSGSQSWTRSTGGRGLVVVHGAVFFALATGEDEEVSIDAGVLNNGQVSVQGGTVRVFLAPGSSSHPGNFTIAPSAEVVLEGSAASLLGVAGRLEGAGTVSAPGGAIVGLTGELRPGGNIAGTMTIASSFAQGTDGTIALQLGGATANAYDRVDFTMPATLTGSVDISLNGGYVPDITDTLTVLTFPATSVVDFAGISAPPGLTPVVTDTSLMLVGEAAPPGVLFTWLGGSGTWDNPAKWDRNAVPGANDTVVIATAGADTVTLDEDHIAKAVYVNGAGNVLHTGMESSLTVTDSVHIGSQSGLLVWNGGLVAEKALYVAGTAVIRQGVVLAPIHVASGGLLLFLGGTSWDFGDYPMPVSLTVDGTLRVDAPDEQVVIDLPFVNNGLVHVEYGMLKLEDVDNTQPGDFALDDDGTLVFDNGGSVTVTGTVTGSGKVWSTGIGVDFIGGFQVDELAVQYGGGTSTTTVSGAISIAQRLEISGGAAVYLESGSAVTVPQLYIDGTLGGDSLRISSALTAEQAYVDWQGDNPVHLLPGATATLEFDFPMTRPFINEGHVFLGGGVTRTATFTRRVEHRAGAVLAGRGNFVFSNDSVVVFDGDLAPGGDSIGTMTITGALTQSATSTLRLQLAGTAVGSFDAVMFTDAVTLNGHLNVALYGAYTPSVGNAFAVVLYPSATVNWADLTLPGGFSSGTSATGVTLTMDELPVGGVISWLGGDGNFEEAAKWDLGRIPNAGDTVIIGGTTSYTVTLNTTRSLGLARMSGTAGVQRLLVAASTVTLLDSLIVGANGELRVEGNAMLNGNGEIAIVGRLQLGNASIGGQGTVALLPGGAADTLRTGGPAYLLGGRVLEVADELVIYASQLEMRDSTHLHVMPTGTVAFAGGSTTYIGAGVATTILNEGTVVQRDSGTAIIYVPFTNHGSVSVQGGEIRVYEAGTEPETGNYSGTGGSLVLGGARTIGGDITGTFRLLTLDTITVAGDVVLPVAEVNSGLFTPQGAFTVADTLITRDGFLNLGRGVPLTLGRVVMIGTGGFTGSDSLTITDSLYWGAGFFEGLGTTVMAPSASAILPASTGRGVRGGHRLYLLNDTHWQQTYTALRDSGQVIVGADATLTVSGYAGFNGSAVSAGETPRFLNFGTIHLDATTEQFGLDVGFENHGQVVVDSGQFWMFAPPGDYTHTGAFTISALGMLRLSASSAQTQTFNGVLRGEGRLWVSTGSLDVTINDSLALSEWQLSNSITRVRGATVIPDSLVIDGGELVLATPDSLTTIGYLLQTAGTITGPDTLLVPAGSVANGSHVGRGVTRVPVGGILNGSGTWFVEGGRRLEVLGTARQANATLLYVNHDSSSLFIAPGGTFDLQGASSIGFVSNPASGINQGTILKSGGGAATINLPFVNEGAVVVDSGTLVLGNAMNPSVHTGTFTVQPGDTLSVSGGTHSIAGSSIVGGGVVRTTNGTLTVTGSPGAATLLVNGGTVEFNGAVAGDSIRVAALTVNSGLVRGTAHVVVEDSLAWNGGTISGASALIVPDTVTATLGVTSRTLSLGRTLQIFGNVIHGTGALTLNDSSRIVVDTGATYEIVDNGAPTGSNSLQRMISRGLVRRHTGATVLAISTNFVNDGVLQVESGTFNITGASGYVATHTGQWTVAAGTTLGFGTAAHTLTGPVTGAGTLNVGSGNVTLAAEVDVAAMAIGGTAVLTSDGHAAVPFLQLAGTLRGTDTLVVTDSMVWTSGTMTDSGAVVIPDSVTVVASTTGSRSILGGRLFDLGGTMVIDGGTLGLGTPITTPDSVALLVRPGALLDVQGTGTVTINTATPAPGRIRNQGTLRRSSGTGTATISARVINEGVVDVQAGTVNLGGTTGVIAQHGTYHVESGATLGFTGAGATDTLYNAVTGAGTVTLGGTNMVALGGVTNASRLNISSGTFRLTSASGHTAIPMLSLTGGTLGGTDTVTILDSLFWSGGTMTDSGVTAIPDSVTVVQTGGVTISGGRILDLSGTLRNTSTGALSLSSIAGRPDSTALIVRPGAVVELQNSGGISSAAPAGHIQLTGTLRRNVGTGTATIGAVLHNDGTVEVATGTLAVASLAPTHGGAWTVGTGATLQFSSAGTRTLTGNVSGLGTFNATNGTTTMAGTLATARVVLASPGTLDLTSAGRQVALPFVDIGSGTLRGLDTLTVTDSLTWTSGVQTDSGVTRVPDSVTVVAQAGTINGGRRLELFGRLIKTGTGTLQLGSVAESPDSIALVVRSGAMVEIQSTGGFTAGTPAGRLVVDAGGVLRKTLAAGAASIVPPLLNNGIVQVDTGTLTIGGATPLYTATHAGTWTAATGATLGFNGGTHALTQPVTGAGALTVSGGNVTFNGDIAPSRLTVTGGTTAITTPDRHTSLPQLMLTGGTLAGFDTLRITDSLAFGAATMSDSGVTIIADTVVGTITTSSVLNSGRRLWVDGTLIHTGTNSTLTDTTTQLVVRAGGLFDVQGNASLNAGATSGQVIVAAGGALRRSVGTGAAAIGARFVNNGTVDVQSGTTFTIGTANYVVTHAGIFNVAAGRTLVLGSGRPTFAGSLSGAGRVSQTVDDTVTFTGTLGVRAVLTSAGATRFLGPALTIDTLQATGGTATQFVQFASGAPVTIPVVRKAGASRLTGTDTLTVSDSLSWEGGPLTGDLTMHVASGATLVMPATTAGRVVDSTAALILAGTGLWNAASTVSVNTNARFDIAPSGTLDISGNGTLTGAGIVANAGSIVRSTSTGIATIANTGLTNTGEVSVQTGTLALSPGAVGLTYGGTWRVASGSALSVVTGAPTFTDSIVGTGTLQVAGDSIVTLAGTLALSRVLLTGARTRLVVNGDFAVADSIGVSATNAIGRLTLNSAVTLPSSAKLVLTSASSIDGTGAIINNGLVHRVNTSSADSIRVAFTNNGIVSTQAPAGFPMTFSGPFAHSAGATLRGQGYLNLPNVTAFDGDIRPGQATATADSIGILRIAGNFTQSSQSTIHTRIAGLGAAGTNTGHDQLVLSGVVTLNGALDAAYVGGFTAASGNTFSVVTFPIGTTLNLAGTTLPLDFLHNLLSTAITIGIP